MKHIWNIALGLIVATVAITWTAVAENATTAASVSAVQSDQPQKLNSEEESPEFSDSEESEEDFERSRREEEDDREESEEDSERDREENEE